VTALLQLAIVYGSGSVALLADAIHNVGDSATAIPLWIAFMLARRKPSERFAYGYGRAGQGGSHKEGDKINFVAEKVNGAITVITTDSATPKSSGEVKKVDKASGKVTIKHGPLDHLGMPAMTMVFGVKDPAMLNHKLADPIVGLLITIAIFGIVWQSAKAVLTRALDGVDQGRRKTRASRRVQGRDGGRRH
jgi:Cu/Ag efflux protein CusF